MGVYVILNIFKRESSVKRDVSLMAEAIRKAFKSVKTELDDHLDAINQNTSELQANQGLLAELEAKIDKLSERLDEIELLIHPDIRDKMNIQLSPREQEVFMALYLSRGLSSVDIAKHLGFTEEMVNNYILSIMSKGVPVKRELEGNVVVFSLDPDFKDVQARRNVLEIDPRIANQLAMHNL